MAIIHRAYSFDPARFHANLESKIVEQGRLRLDVLRDWAADIVANASPTVQQTLKDIRFDDEWLDASDESVSRSDFWYMIVLAETLSPMPSLSNRLPVSWRVLREILPYVGWNTAEVELIIRGKWLRTLVESSGNTLFTAEFTTLDQFGGWLSVDDQKTLWSRLLSVEHYFPFPTKELPESFLSFANLWLLSPTEMLEKGFADAREMLQAAIAQNSALLVALD